MHVDKVSSGDGEDRTCIDDALEEVALMDLDAEASGGSSIKLDGVDSSSETCSLGSEACSGPLFNGNSSSVCPESSVLDVVMYSPPCNALLYLRHSVIVFEVGLRQIAIRGVAM